MRKICLLRLLLPTIFAFGASAQRIQNMDIFFLAGPSFAKTQLIGGSNVTVYGSTGYCETTGYGYQFMRRSAVSLWAELLPFASVHPSAETASIPGSISLTSSLFVPSLRVMAPVQSRISIFGVLGAGLGDFSSPNLTSNKPPNLTTSGSGHLVTGVGGGVDFRLTRMFSLRVDVRDFITGRNLSGVPGRNHVLPMMGFAAHF